MSEKVSNEFKIASFVQKQKLPYEAKVKYAIMRAKEYYDIVTGEMGANVHVSVGGLDSITLLLFLRKYVDSNIKAVSVSSLEDKSIQRVHKLLGIEMPFGRTNRKSQCSMNWDSQ